MSTLTSTSAKCLDLNICLFLKEIVVYYLDHQFYHSVANTVVQRLCLLQSELGTKHLQRLLF